MTSKAGYPKKVISFDKQIKLLKERGLIIENPDFTKEYLRNISDFRLQGFWWEFQIDKENHKFKEGTTFKNIIDLYNFDRKFRLIIFDALERIEIALRTKLVYYPSIELDQWWFENENNFFSRQYHQESLREVDK
jgi:abortive infection bacteriophage resistance protein